MAVKSMADIVGGTMAEEAGIAQARSVLDVTLGILIFKGEYKSETWLSRSL